MEHQTGPSIGILDMSGFETLPKNGFEQLCINAANEQLQTFFNESVFLQEEMDYKLEEIDANEVNFKNNQPVVDLLFQVRKYNSIIL
ncbi:hypothetical protein KUTeg_017540 [Tegillarca granosa]|uniref:Myosin motor domain-containing protein n=1 Tax=Tegillarca granosa TaxID=220873 RepID=A0ABQ9EK42_TEGGR|nr:hypothetical protein KUTeg_017540 [Tegillarca granosa]